MRRHFTHIAWATLLVAYATGGPHVSCLATCFFYGSFASFFVVPLLDPTAYRRMARKNGWSMPLFHAGNLLLHAAPLGVLPFAHVQMHPAHGVVAAALHVLWGLWAAGDGTLRLDDVYVPLRDWRVPWLCAVGAEVGAAIAFSAS